MDLKSLSASSALVFEGCVARWADEYAGRAGQPSNSAAGLGTVCHTTAEVWVGERWYLKPYDSATLQAIYDEAYWSMFTDTDRYQEGLDMMRAWVERTDWTGRTVLSTEVKSSFPIKTSIGEVPFNYIWDRCDRLADGEIEVIDYKTIMAPLRPDNMKKKIQVRAYGLAAAIQFPDAKRIWITLDQLRYEPVSCSFSRDENIETWSYLKKLAERIIAAEPVVPKDGGDAKFPETLNVDCRYCVRKHACDELRKHEVVGGALGITDAHAAAERKYRLESARTAMANMIDDLDRVVLEYCETEDLIDFKADGVDVAIVASGKRVIDPVIAARILGPELAGEFPGGIGIGVIDRLMKEKSPRLSEQQRADLKAATRREFGDARVKVTASDPTA